MPKGIKGILANLAEDIGVIGKKQFKLPKGVVAQRMDVAAPKTGRLPGISLTTNPQSNRRYLELLHGTNTMPPFDELRLGSGNDIHLAEDPYVAEAFAGGVDPWGSIPMGGARVYPVLADPGENPFKREYGMLDPGIWDNPAAMFHRLKGDYERFPEMVTPQLNEIVGDLGRDISISDAMKNRGYTSMEYEHASFNPDNPDNVIAHLFTNPKQIMPKYSPEGILAVKEGRVKPIDYSKYPNKFDIEMQDPYVREEFEDFQNPETIKRLLKDPDPDARKLLKYWGYE